MFDGWGRLVYRRRRLVLVTALIVVAFAAAWGTGVFGKLQSAGGFTAPGSQSQQSVNLETAAVTGALSGLARTRVDSVTTYWSTGSSQFISASGHQTYAVIEMAGSTDD